MLNLVQSLGYVNSVRHILKSIASMHESSDSQFVRTATGTQSGSDAFDKSRLVVKFLMNLGITSIMQFQISSRKENR